MQLNHAERFRFAFHAARLCECLVVRSLNPQDIRQRQPECTDHARFDCVATIDRLAQGM